MNTKNQARKFVLINILLSLAFLFTMLKADPYSDRPTLMAVSFFAVLFILNFTVFAYESYHDIRNLILKMQDKQRPDDALILDLRDGTRQHYHEKRKFVRIKKDLTAQLIGRDMREYIKTVDISFGGALLRSSHEFAVGDTIDINLYLPIYAAPVSIRVRVVRVVRVSDTEPETTLPMYNIGVKYLNMPDETRQKLTETIELLIKKQKHD